jgi:hypothetical protein
MLRKLRSSSMADRIFTDAICNETACLNFRGSKCFSLAIYQNERLERIGGNIVTSKGVIMS